MTIAAGAALTKDVPENDVVGRISAKVINSFNNNFCKYYDKKCNTESFSSEYSVYFVFLVESKKTPWQ